ncbi:TetR/AcrR family transcriptional regulator [Streptomyces solincola]|uniref:TetR/AcrR family transcriptional regulator n=1 Tax=Streptomyces solincola TaxID=2100817 RepID=A0A2S9PZK5_9ACTN|nr:TetR family transcriptional regulator [Streptomyces solincola]PRH79828.1 TetR/AcrR family transcriptional regulator [Streptomyces solincola]
MSSLTEDSGATARGAAEEPPGPRRPGGRRPGETRTRAAILDAARTCFAERGYDATSLRRIAAEAGVDQALLHHFYGTKENLFLQALELPARMREAIGAAARGPRDGLGERLVRAHLTVWEDLSARPALLTLVRSAPVHQAAAAHLRENLGGVLGAALAEPIGGGEDARLRANLVATQLIGLSLTRYILALEPLADADADTVAGLYSPALQAVIDADRTQPAPQAATSASRTATQPPSA